MRFHPGRASDGERTHENPQAEAPTKMERQTASHRAKLLARTCLVLGGLLVVGAGGGCVPAAMSVRPTAYELDVSLDTEQHTVTGRTTVQLSLLPEQKTPDGPAAIELKLHRDLLVDSVEVTGAILKTRTAERTRVKAHDTDVLPITHRIIVTDPEPQIEVTVEYHGKLHQDVSAGEKEGQIHNFAMSAHVAPEGVYLDESGYWYPVADPPEDSDPELALADYRLTADPIDGLELVAGLEREADTGDGRLHWSSPIPLERVVLLGGPFKRWSRQHGGVTLHAVLDPSKEAVAQDVLDLIGECLDKYEPLIGPYPFKEFTVLEAFFSSGFAFPTCTQLDGSRLTLYKPYRRHGYLDHEFLHSWWGNGIYVDPGDGNWCEAFASYGANYYGYILDGDEEGARKKRRDHSNFLSSIKPEDDKPLGTYGQEDGAGRGIAYSKGAAVLHMIERRIGRQAFFDALRRFTAEYTGKFADWDDIRRLCEEESGTDLTVFFDQWVRGGGAPALELTGADWRPGADKLDVWLSQGDTDFVLDVPLRLSYGDRSVDAIVKIDESTDTVEVPCETTGLTAVELDPDYHLFRKLKRSEIMPTSSLTKQGKKLLIVVPDGELWDGYHKVVQNFTEAVTGEPDEPKKDAKVRTKTATEVTEDDLRNANVLVLGDAVHATPVRDLLDRTACPVTWDESAFHIEGETYADAGQAVLMTVHHPDRPEGGVTVYFGRSPAALGNAGVLSFYGNSLLVFEIETQADGSAEVNPHTGMPHAEVIRRMDFESHDRIEF